MSAWLGKAGQQQLEGLLEWPRMAEGRGDREWFRVPEHYLLQISISTMSDKSWTLDVATESGERQEHRRTPASVTRLSFKSWHIFKIGSPFTNVASLSCPGAQVPTSPWPTKHKAQRPQLSTQTVNVQCGRHMYL